MSADAGGAVARAACELLPQGAGVYRFRDSRGRVIYLGKASNLRSRVRSYWGDLADRRHLRRMVPQICTVEALVCATAHEAAWLERNLLTRSLPRWNRVRGGQEVPAWLVLDENSRTPGLHIVTCEPGPAAGAYGPYLGAERTRAGRSGLLRAWPVHLSGTALGSMDRGLASARGVTAADRARMARNIRSVLGRDAAALADCAATLEAARERAVAHLAFESAQQILQEMAAVEWLAATQRVTGCVPADLVVHGWADGLLLTLAARGGRMSRWTTRAAAAAHGERLADAAPGDWREFAATNAALAVRLARAQQGMLPTAGPVRPPATPSTASA